MTCVGHALMRIVIGCYDCTRPVAQCVTNLERKINNLGF